MGGLCRLNVCFSENSRVKVLPRNAMILGGGGLGANYACKVEPS